MKLLRRKFIANIAVPENGNSTLVIPSVEGGQRRDKPDVFVGLVEDVADDCQWVRPGMKVAFLRFDYGTQSADIGEDRVVVDEKKDVLILGEHTAAPGIVAVNILEKESEIEIPDWVKANQQTFVLMGQVVASGWVCGIECVGRACQNEHVNVNDIVYFRNIPEAQYRLGSHTVIFDNLCRHCRDHVKMDCAADIILAKIEQVAIPKLAVCA